MHYNSSLGSVGGKEGRNEGSTELTQMWVVYSPQEEQAARSSILASGGNGLGRQVRFYVAVERRLHDPERVDSKSVLGLNDVFIRAARYESVPRQL